MWNSRRINYKKEGDICGRIYQEKEYDIPIEDNIREEVEEMCNLSQGIKEKAFEGGYAEGKQNGYAEAICMMYESAVPIEQIAEIIKMSTDRVKELLKFDL